MTICKLNTVEDALACVPWYCLRWRIEDWHRVLKSGCAIEALAHKTRTRLERVIAIRLVIGWRVMQTTLLGRTCPALPADVLFSDVEIEVLEVETKKRFAAPKTLGAAVRLVARLGGYIGRRKDSPPGHDVIWRGQAQRVTMCEGFALGKGSVNPIKWVRGTPRH